MPSSSIQFYVALVCAILALIVWSSMRSRDPYGFFHLALNKLPGEHPDDPPKTEWLNMGYWKNTKTFPEASRALALKLISAAPYKEGASVLDVGHGTGESLLLLLSGPSLPVLGQLSGITSLEAHYQRSLNRVDRYLGGSTQIDLASGDAVFRGTSKHPLDPADHRRFDTILALDCAYHFDTRRKFLEQSFLKLAPGGRIALADICYSPPSNILLKRWLSPIPKANEITVEGYVAQMEEMGYVDVVAEDITEDVFPGFVRFLKSRNWGWWMFGCVISQVASSGARFVIMSGGKA